MQRLNVPVLVNKGHLKFNSQPGQGSNSGPSGSQSEMLPTVLTSQNMQKLRILSTLASLYLLLLDGVVNQGYGGGWAIV